MSNGSLFTYFATKGDMFNQLFLELKADMATAALEGLPAGAELRKRTFHAWRNWMRWAVSNPEKRRALAQLYLSEEITSSAPSAGRKQPAEKVAELVDLMEQCRSIGPMQNTPLGFVAAIMNAMAEATMDFMVHDPPNADRHCRAGFEAFWRVVGG